MTVSVQEDEDGIIRLAGICSEADAVSLLRFLSEKPGATVDWRECEYVHSAVLQVLFVAKPTLLGSPVNPFLKRHIEPLLTVEANPDLPVPTDKRE